MGQRTAYASLVVWSMLLILAGTCAAQEKPTKSPFAGEYSGPYTAKGAKPEYPDDKGKYTITISADGKITGSTNSDITGDTTKLTGAVDGNGKVELTVEYDTSTYTMKGTVTRTTTGSINGTLVQYSGKEIVGRDEIDLSPK